MGSPPGLRVELLGGFRVAVGGSLIEQGSWRRQKARALVALLALTKGHRLHREQLTDRLWPDLDPAAASNNLRKALHFARRTLSDDLRVSASLLFGERGTLSLAPGTWVDVEAFDAAAARARRGSDAETYEEAIRLYAGDLLPEDRYEEWVLGRSEELRQEFLALLREQAELWESRGELDRAAAVLRRATLEDPFNEELCGHLMRASALAGRRREALEAYERLSTTLGRELTTEPSVEIQRLREEIAAGKALAPELTAELWERVGDLRLLSGDVEGAAAAFESSIQVARTTAARSSPARLHRKAAQAYLGGHDADRAEPHVAKARATNEKEASAQLLVLEANVAWERSELDTAAERASGALELAEQQGDARDLAAAHEAMAIVCHYRGAWRDGLLEEIDRLANLPDEDSDLAGVFDIHHCMGQYHLYGDALWPETESYARETLHRAQRIGAVRAQAFAWCLLGESLLLQSRFDEAEGCLQRSGELHESLGGRAGGLPWQRLAELQVCRGRPEAAPAFLRKAEAIATISPMARHLWGRIHATSALAALELGDVDDAVRAVRAAARTAVRYGDCPTCSALLNPMGAEAFGRLGDSESILPHVEAARRTAGMFDSSAWSAMAVSSEGSLLLAQGNASASTDRFRAAAELSRRAGQPYWADRAEKLAAAAGNARGTPPT